MGVFSNVRLRVTYHTVVCVAMSSVPKLQGLKIGCYPKGYAAPSDVPCQCNMRRSPSKLKRTLPQSKIYVTSKSPVGDISVVTLIRTDTTLDHSQEAEKVWASWLCRSMYVDLFSYNTLLLTAACWFATPLFFLVPLLVGPKPP